MIAKRGRDLFGLRRVGRLTQRLRVPDAFELFLAYLCLASGLPLALGAPPPASIQRVLPPWLIHLWGVTLFLGGLLIAVGIMMRYRGRDVPRLVLGLRIERAGLAPLAAGSALFGLAIASVAGWRGVLPAGTYLAFSVACLFRSREARDVEKGALTALHTAMDKTADR